MAKLKAPLMSLGASGQLGKALVFFPWKGLDVVREYVIPANPKSALQTTQRGYLADAVESLHAHQAQITEGFDSIDISACSLWASVVKAATTWFNQVCKNWIDVAVAGNTPTLMRAGTLDLSTPGECDFQIIAGSAAMVNATLYWGRTKTALIHAKAMNVDVGYFKATITGLTAGVKYFMQMRADDGDACEGVKSGIYFGYAT